MLGDHCYRVWADEVSHIWYSPHSKGWVLSLSLMYQRPLLHFGAELSSVVATSQM